MKPKMYKVVSQINNELRSGVVKPGLVYKVGEWTKALPKTGICLFDSLARSKDWARSFAINWSVYECDYKHKIQMELAYAFSEVYQLFDIVEKNQSKKKRIVYPRFYYCWPRGTHHYRYVKLTKKVYEP